MFPIARASFAGSGYRRFDCGMTVLCIAGDVVSPADDKRIFGLYALAVRQSVGSLDVQALLL